MTNYSASEVKKSVRRFSGAINELINSSYSTYRSRIDNFIEMSKSDPVISSIVNPLREMDIDFDEIYQARNGYWINEVKLPTNPEARIAYVIKTFEKVSEKEISLDDLTARIYKHKRYEDNVRDYFYDIARPQLNELLCMLEDLIEEEVSGKETVSESSLQIINNGIISAQQGSNIAMGQSIQQSVEYKNITKEIMEKVQAEGIIEEEKLPEVEIVAKEVEEELSKPEPSKSKLKQLAGKVADIGEEGLLKTFTSVVTNPVWAQAVTEKLLGM